MPIFTRVAFNPTQNIQTVFILFVIKYKKTTAETDKQVRIKTHPLQRKTVPTTIFEDIVTKKDIGLKNASIKIEDFFFNYKRLGFLNYKGR